MEARESKASYPSPSLNVHFWGSPKDRRGPSVLARGLRYVPVWRPEVLHILVHRGKKLKAKFGN